MFIDGFKVALVVIKLDLMLAILKFHFYMLVSLSLKVNSTFLSSSKTKIELLSMFSNLIYWVNKRF